MSAVRASAPGKLVFCGEYAVLDGAPAIGIAVNRRSVVTAAAAAGGEGSYRCPGYADRLHRYASRADGSLAWLEDDGLPLVEAAAAAFGRPPVVDAVLDTSAFSHAAAVRKLGLGSSASLSVSLTATFAELLGDTAKLTTAHDAHRIFQGGRGSGIDVATCFAGGVIEFSMDRRDDPRGMGWPQGLCFALFWTGVPSSTVDRIRHFEETAGTRNTARLARASADVIDAWADAGRLLQATGAYAETLRAFDRDLGLDIFCGGHERLWRLAERYQVIYKPCGAGGGDIGIAVAAAPGALDEFAQAAVVGPVERLDAQIDFDGVIVEECHR